MSENPLIERTLAALAKRKFTPHFCQTPTEAEQLILSNIRPKQSVGIGGSMTIKELSLDQKLEDKGCSVYWHWNSPPETRTQVLHDAHTADVYLTSTNAITHQGSLVNIDGNGNRVANLFAGPDVVWIVAGTNKLVEGGLEKAVERIKTQACGKNARRLNLNTPCAHTDHCTPEGQCFSADRICKTLVELSYCPPDKTVHVVLVDCTLGY